MVLGQGSMLSNPAALELAWLPFSPLGLMASLYSSHSVATVWPGHRDVGDWLLPECCLPFNSPCRAQLQLTVSLFVAVFIIFCQSEITGILLG